MNVPGTKALAKLGFTPESIARPLGRITWQDGNGKKHTATFEQHYVTHTGIVIRCWKYCGKWKWSNITPRTVMVKGREKGLYLHMKSRSGAHKRVPVDAIT